MAGNPQFDLINSGSRPKLQKGQMTIIYKCLERKGRLALTDLVSLCDVPEYRETFRNPNTDITDSVLYHLKRMQEATAGRIKNAQRPVVRKV
jgi:hypothetical protein